MITSATSGRWDEVLHSLRMSGTFYCKCRFESPWGVAFPETIAEARFHLVTEGTAAVYGPGIQPMVLAQGDFVLLPRGAPHAIVDQLGSPLTAYEEISPEYLSERYAQYQRGGDGPGTRLVCVTARFDDALAQRLLSMLPPAIHVKSSSADQEWMHQTVQFIAAEAKNLRPGGETIITRLADVLVIQAIRWCIEHEHVPRRGWLGGMQDARIGQVITLIHQRPEHPWSLASLAQQVGMSRSALSARFKDLVGDSVMHYLAAWRMHVALTSLRQDRVDLGQLAERVGYQSETAFNRAFRRHIGEPPGAFKL
jgi:AraC-like DNA-binding protein